MAVLGWVFVRHVFATWLAPDQSAGCVAGLILRGGGTCTAMVFVWSHLVGGELHFTPSQVALNDAIMIMVFAPVVGAVPGAVGDCSSVGDALPLGVALHRPAGVLAQIWRRVLLNAGSGALEPMLGRLHSVSLVALLATLVLLFALAGRPDRAAAPSDRHAGRSL